MRGTTEWPSASKVAHRAATAVALLPCRQTRWKGRDRNVLSRLVMPPGAIICGTWSTTCPMSCSTVPGTARGHLAVRFVGAVGNDLQRDGQLYRRPGRREFGQGWQQKEQGEVEGMDGAGHGIGHVTVGAGRIIQRTVGFDMADRPTQHPCDRRNRAVLI